MDEKVHKKEFQALWFVDERLAQKSNYWLEVFVQECFINGKESGAWG